MKNYYKIYLIDADKAFDKTHHSLTLRIPIKVGVEKKILNFFKGIYKKPRANFSLNCITLCIKLLGQCLAQSKYCKRVSNKVLCKFLISLVRNATSNYILWKFIIKY